MPFDDEETEIDEQVEFGKEDLQRLDDFITRHESTIESIEKQILSLESEQSQETSDQLRRDFHTLKGDAGILKLWKIEKVCHVTEDILTHLNGAAEIIDVVLNVKDWLARYFYTAKTENRSISHREIVEHLQVALGNARELAPKTASRVITENLDLSKTEGETGLLLEKEAVPASDGQPKPREDTVGTKSEAADSEPEGAKLAAEFLEMVPNNLDANLFNSFLSEAIDHLHQADVCLLNMEADTGDIESINTVYGTFHTIKGIAGFLDLSHIKSTAHHIEYLLERVKSKTIVLAGDVIDTIFDGVEVMRKMVENLSASVSTGNPLAKVTELPALIHNIDAILRGKVSRSIKEVNPSSQRLGDILVAKGLVTHQQIDEVLAIFESTQGAAEIRIGEKLVVKRIAGAKDVSQALRSQLPAKDHDKRIALTESVKVDALRLDRLIEMIGELVIAESMVCESSEIKGLHSQTLTRHISQLNKITRELQELATALRMIPLRSTFQMMARMIRDLSKKTGKNAVFSGVGEDVELDKVLVDKIHDPLVHLIRNAVDHGIEDDSDMRVQQGKPALATIELWAFHKGGSIFIEIEDDGKGLDEEVIRKKAIENGLIGPDEQLSESDLYQLIFQAGFSTAKTVTDVSGRGVGMDVVKRGIEQMRGQIEISSTQGKGSIFSIRLPLTLAIIDGMVVQVEQERYIIPTQSILRTLSVEKACMSEVLDQGEVYLIDGEYVPLFRLVALFGVETNKENSRDGIILVVEDEGRQVALLVDSLLGQQQIVIKPLGDAMKSIKGISGGAIMPDGKVGLIADVSELVKIASSGDADRFDANYNPTKSVATYGH